jgi:ribonuclease Y
MARLRAQTAHGLADQILGNANREAETIRIQAQLQSQQETLRRREELERENEENRKDLREQERRVEKRADLLDQKLDLINRKEREFESIQRYLSEQQDDLQKRQQELKQTYSEQRELLQRIGRLTSEEARTILLKRVEEELDQCWDLLRQRRAKREFGKDPDTAQPRDIGTVENYTG